MDVSGPTTGEAADSDPGEGSSDEDDFEDPQFDECCRNVAALALNAVRTDDLLTAIAKKLGILASRGSADVVPAGILAKANGAPSDTKPHTL